MSALRQFVVAMNGGELSPRLEGRVDLDGIYDRGFAEMFNFVATVEGPAIKRSGTRYIKAAAASSTWLSRFVFNVTQAYILEWLEAAVRFYTNGAQILDGPDPYEVAVPYTAAQAPFVSSAQSYDRLYLAHPSHPPAALTRTGAETFAYEVLELVNGPFKDTNTDEGITITAAGDFELGGSCTLTASEAIFTADHVGAPFMLEAKDFSDIVAWEPGYDGVVIGDKRRSDGKAYEAATAGRSGTVQPTHTSGTEWDGVVTGQDVNAKDAGGIQWTYVHDRFGMGTITAIGGAGTEATITVTRRIPDSLGTVASHKWAHGAFSDAEGWPQLVVLGFGRLIFFKGVEIFGSVVGDYGGGRVNFAPLTDGGLFSADMAFRRTLDAADPPLWARLDKEALIVGTASGEILITPVNSAEPISGDNMLATRQSSYGSAQVWPIDVGIAALFVQRGKRKVREVEYTYERERFVGLNITVWARHITRSGVKQLAFQQEPEEMVWAVRDDGVLAAHPHSPEQQVKGWSRVQLGAGTVLSVEAIPSEDGGRDELWLLAELDGDKAVLQLADWWDEDRELDDAGKLEQLKGAFFVDFGVSYSGAAQTEFNTGLDHLVGREVWILADGGVCPPQTVQATNPKITLPYAASEVHIGIGYEARLKPMRPEVRGAPTLQGLRKRITRLMLRLIDAGGLIVRDRLGRTDRLIDRPGSSTMNQPVPLFNGDTTNKAVGGGYDYDGQDTIVSTDPLPCIVVAQLRQLEVEA